MKETFTSFRSIGRVTSASFCALVTAAAGLMVATPSAAETDYPNRPIRMIVAYAPGGSTDVLGRMFAQELSAKLGQSIVVENKPGGGTSIGTTQVIRSNNDGYTLLFGTPATVITPMLYKDEPWDVVNDLTSVSLATVQSMGVLVSQSLDVKSIPELIDFAKKNPGAINFASSGNGSAQHLSAEALSEKADIKMTHIPYKGAGIALNDLISGQVHVMITSLVDSMMANVKDGRLKLIALTGPERNRALSNIPTIAEGGVPGFDITTFTGIFAAANTPSYVVEKIGRAMKEIQKDGKIQKLIESQAMDVHASSGAEMKEMMVKEKAFYQAIVDRTGAKRD